MIQISFKTHDLYFNIVKLRVIVMYFKAVQNLPNGAIVLT